MTNKTNETIWKLLKTIKSEFIGKNCPNYQQLHGSDIMSTLVNEVERRLKVISSDMFFKNVTESKLQSAAKMFIYLTTCSQSVKSWFFFYEDLFTQHSPAEIIVTLNRVLKGEKTQKNMDRKTIATKIFSRLDHFLSLKYFEIRNMTKGTVSSFLEKIEGINSMYGIKIQFSKLYKLLEKVVENLVNVSNHPVHIKKGNGELSPSAFIPFCEFGGDMSSMGENIDQFDVPVCNSFQAKVLNDQLCYEVDLNSFSNKSNIENELKSGFAFIMDYNEDRQTTFDEENINFEENGLVNRIVKSDNDKHAHIFLDTIGNDAMR